VVIKLTDEMFNSICNLPSISLTDLQAEAEFLIRRDRKYLIPSDEVSSILGGIDLGTRVLEIDGRRSFGYLSSYFDDDSYSAYLRAARRRPNRFKVRTRLYTESGLCMLELKVRDGRGMTVKHRIAHDSDALECLGESDREWLGTFPAVEPFADRFRHRMTSFYHRVTLVLPRGEGRVTLDRDLVFEHPTGSRVGIPSYLIIETKGSGPPTSIDRLLWASGRRPVSMSKFAAGLSLLIPELPANRWHRLHAQLSAAIGEYPEFLALPAS
jgi:hypothetical protein